MTAQTSTLPLTYYGHFVGHAQVDSWLKDHIPSRVTWGLELPEALRSAHRNRPDIICARLTTEPELLSRCHPFAQINGLVIRLCKLALRPQAIEVLHLLYVPGHAYSTQAFIRHTLATVSRVSFVNRSRVDCRSSNLREVLPPEATSQEPGDTHPSSPTDEPFNFLEFLT